MQAKSFFIFVLAAVFSHAAIAQSRSILPDSATASLDSAVHSLMKAKKITGASVAIVDHGHIVYAKGFGYGDKRKNIHASENTIYCIGSATKMFTAMAIMKLHDEGKIDLDKPASYYLPDLKIKSLVEQGDILKIKNLLNHTSGLTDGILNYDLCSREYDVNSVIAELNKQVEVHKTNWRFSYSNVGFDLLGCIVERVSGMKYDAYIRKNFMEKMDMAHSGFNNHPDDTLYSKGYKGDTTETAEPILRDVPAGRIFSNVMDMSRFMMMVLNNGVYNGRDILSKQGLEAMETSHLNDVTLKDGPTYGYGMFVEKMYYTEDSIYGSFVGHPGDTYVFHATCGMFPKSQLGMVILTNSEQGHSFCNTGFIKLVGLYQKKVKGIQLHPAAAMAADSVKKLVSDLPTSEIEGNYTSGEETVLKIKRISDRKLSMREDNQHLILKKMDDGTYSITAKVFLIIPIKVKGAFFGFEKKDGNIYFKQISKKYGRAEYVSIKDHPTPLSDAWKNTAGKYKAINSCEGNMQGIPEEIKIKGDKIFLAMRFDKKTVENYSFNAINDTLAAIDGIDRYSGMIMKIMPNGHLYFSGYELVKENGEEAGKTMR